jgi:hypothetical protein
VPLELAWLRELVLGRLGPLVAQECLTAQRQIASPSFPNLLEREPLEPVDAVAIIRRRPLRSQALPEALSCDFGQIRPKLVATGSITI